MLLGAHVSADDPLRRAQDRGAELVQFFLGNPQSWKQAPPRPDAESLRASPIPVYVHAPYLINVANPSSRIRIPSRKILSHTLAGAEAIGAAGVIVHGGHVADGEHPKEGFDRWRKALQQAESEVPILIENTAGGEGAQARRLDVLAALWEVIGDFGPGFCLDTCHAWAGGEPLEGLAERVRAATGRIDLVHLNDSRDPFDSRRDRHANLGQGQIPPDLLAEVVREAGAPALVETPGDVPEHQADLAWIRTRLAAAAVAGG